MKLKNYIGWILMLLAVGVGVLAFYLVTQYLSSQEEALRLDVMRGRGATQKVVVAREALEAGAVIGPTTMAIGELPAQHVPARAVAPSNFKTFEGRVLSRQMSAGEPLLADFVSGYLIDRFSDLLEPGERAISLEVSAVANHAGMLVPGDYIDLYSLTPIKTAGPSGPRKKLIPLLDRVKVLAAGPEPLRAADQPFQRLPEKASHYSMITVGVPSAEAERLLLSRETDEVVYLLRNAADDAPADSNLRRAAYDDEGKGYRYYSIGLPEGQRRLADSVLTPPSGARSGSPRSPDIRTFDDLGATAGE